jgi:protein phosphatase PTC7
MFRALNTCVVKHATRHNVLRLFAQQYNTHNVAKDYGVITAAKCRSKTPHKMQNAKNKDKPNCGEDAYFILKNDQHSIHEKRLISAMGVADGVGGYAEIGVDPSLMAWQVMDNVKQRFEECNKSTDPQEHDLIEDPREILYQAYQRILTEKQVKAGGTTACVVSIFTNQDVLNLQYANLGDSAFMVVRNDKILFRSKDQTHQFNTPYQLSVPLRGEGNHLLDDPRDAGSFPPGQLLKLEQGDYIIMGTVI